GLWRRRPPRGAPSRSKRASEPHNLSTMLYTARCAAAQLSLAGAGNETQTSDRAMDFNIPQDIADYLLVLDHFIEREIRPLENKDDNIRFFDHRREAARTDWDRG